MTWCNFLAIENLKLHKGVCQVKYRFNISYNDK